MSKTKPDGFVFKDWRRDLESASKVRVYNCTAFERIPTCLVHPEVCDKVREFLEHIVKDGGVVIEEIEECKRAAELLKLLPEVE